MTIITIPQILEVKLAEISPSIATVSPNSEYTPVPGTPYQIVDFLFTRPSNDYVHRGYNQRGYMQITLAYPELGGALNIRTRVQAIRDKFKSGDIFSGVKIESTPEAGAARNEGDRYVVPVFVYFSQYNTET